MAGMNYRDIALKHRISVRSVERAMAEARRKHGKDWPSGRPDVPISHRSKRAGHMPGVSTSMKRIGELYTHGGRMPPPTEDDLATAVSRKAYAAKTLLRLCYEAPAAVRATAAVGILRYDVEPGTLPMVDSASMEKLTERLQEIAETANPGQIERDSDESATTAVRH